MITRFNQNALFKLMLLLCSGVLVSEDVTRHPHGC